MFTKGGLDGAEVEATLLEAVGYVVVDGGVLDAPAQAPLARVWVLHIKKLTTTVPVQYKYVICI